MLNLMKDWDHARQMTVANYLIGIQAMTVVIYNLLGLLLARDLQARYFNPGGFKQEILSWHMQRITGLLGILIIYVEGMEYALVINLLPSMLLFAMCAGASCVAYVLEQKKIKHYGLVVLVPLLALPVFVCPIYILIGFLDSILDFRQKIHKR